MRLCKRQFSFRPAVATTSSVLDQPPFPLNGSAPAVQPETEVSVIVPTRNRPEKLRRCLDALAAARDRTPFTVHVCDSSGPEIAPRVKELCARHPFVELVRHDRRGASAARNVGTRAARSELVVSVDDDVYVEPGAIDALVRVSRARGDCVVAGTVGWSHWWSRPLVMRRIGFGREAQPREPVEFLVSALVLYPRDLGLAFPWNERLWPYDDRYVSLIWRAAGARLAFAPDARAHHDEVHTEYPVGHEADRIYVNALDAAMVSRSIGRLIAFELLGFAACAKKWARTPRGAWGILRAWIRGHLALLRDLRALRATLAVARRSRAERATA
jgi:glycosyltransferase involved in cell wall biosynthesis